MFDIGPSELLLCAVIALVVIGPKDLPRVMRTVGEWAARARGVARHFRSGVDTMIREAELEEMQKQWAAENARIMAEHPPGPQDDGAQPLLPDPDAPLTEDHAPPPAGGDGATADAEPAAQTLTPAKTGHP